MAYTEYSKYLLAALLLAVSETVKAQVTAVVFDMETRRPIEGASVYVNPRGMVKTDRHGRFTVDGECRSLTVSSQGYESRSMDKSGVGDTVWMLPNGRRLGEIVVIGHRPKIGFDTGKYAGKGQKQPSNKSGIGGFDFFDSFNFKKHKQAKRRKKIKEILDKY